MNEYESALIEEIKAEAEQLGDKADRIISICNVLLNKQPSEITPEKSNG